MRGAILAVAALALTAAAAVQKAPSEEEMTKVQINAGVCGFTALVSVKKDKDRNVRLSIETGCEMVKKMAEEISFLEFRAPFSAILHNPVYRSASKNLQHPACPVPSGILKAIEVEVGACLPRPSGITFIGNED